MYLCNHFMNMHFYLFLLRGCHRPPVLCLSPSPAFSLMSASRLTTQKHLWGRTEMLSVQSIMPRGTKHAWVQIPQSVLDLHTGFSTSQSYWVKCQTKKMQLVFVRDGMNSLYQVTSTAEPVKMKDLVPHTCDVHLVSSQMLHWICLLQMWITETLTPPLLVFRKKYMYCIRNNHLKCLESKILFHFIPDLISPFITNSVSLSLSLHAFLFPLGWYGLMLGGVATGGSGTAQVR